MPLAVVTVMVTVPFFTPLTTPLALTVAMPAEPAGVTLILSDSFSFLPFFTLYKTTSYCIENIGCKNIFILIEVKTIDI